MDGAGVGLSPCHKLLLAVRSRLETAITAD